MTVNVIRPNSSVTSSVAAFKKNKLYQSTSDAADAIKHKLRNDTLRAQSQIPSSGLVHLRPSQIAKSFKQFLDVAVDENDVIYIYNPETQVMDSSFRYFKRVVSELTADHKIITFEIADLDTTTRRAYEHLRNMSDVRKLQTQKRGVVVFGNCVIDLKNQVINPIDNYALSNDIISRTSRYYVPLNELKAQGSHEQINKAIYYREIIQRVMTEWSGDDPEVEKLLWQIVIACLEGDNRGLIILIKGAGGNGKSSFLKLLKYSCEVIEDPNDTSVVSVNIDQWNDDNAIGLISSSTKLVIGDDAASNHTVDGKSLGRLKTMTTYDQGFVINVKYQPSRNLTSNAVIIQSTNTNIRFKENSDAVADRTMLIEWVNTNYRQKQVDFDLDQMMSDADFRDQFATLAIEKLFEYGYFTKFDIPKSVRENMQEMIDVEDDVISFFENHYDELKYYHEIAVSQLHEGFKEYIRQANPGVTPLSYKAFKKRIEMICNRFSFVMNDTRSHFALPLDYQSHAISDVLGIDSSTRFRSVSIVNNSNLAITDDELKAFDTEISSGPKRQYDEKERQMLRILAKQQHTIAIQEVGAL